jgi:hypothetical protein
MAVCYEHSSRGVGRILLLSLKALARTERTQALPFGVDPRNFARTLFETEGFIDLADVPDVGRICAMSDPTGAVALLMQPVYPRASQFEASTTEEDVFWMRNKGTSLESRLLNLEPRPLSEFKR